MAGKILKETNKYVVEVLWEKDTLAGYRETILTPTLQISDNLWWDESLWGVMTKDYKRIYLFIRWAWFRVGLAITWG